MPTWHAAPRLPHLDALAHLLHRPHTCSLGAQQGPPVCHPGLLAPCKAGCSFLFLGHQELPRQGSACSGACWAVQAVPKVVDGQLDLILAQELQEAEAVGGYLPSMEMVGMLATACLSTQVRTGCRWRMVRAPRAPTGNSKS